MAAFTTTRMRQENFLKIIMFIVISTILIFYADIITPLGFAVWILYFIPLVLTLYLEWKFAPIASAGFFLLLLAISYFSLHATYRSFLPSSIVYSFLRC